MNNQKAHIRVLFTIDECKSIFESDKNKTSIKYCIFFIINKYNCEMISKC
jgi:hypothetical protein